MHLNRKRVRALLREWIPAWAILPLISIFVLNMLIYAGSGWLTASRYHYDLTMGIDRMVPFLPPFIWIYVLAFRFWGVGYILFASWGKDGFYRLVATDITIHLICLVFFLILPTTNVRPEVPGSSLSDMLLRFVYAVDGGDMPSNLFPSIHCYVSWLCWRGCVGNPKVPKAYQRFSLVMAVLIVISTQVLKQHYLVDAVAALVLVEVFWRFYRKGRRHEPFMRFFEKLNGLLPAGEDDHH